MRDADGLSTSAILLAESAIGQLHARYVDAVWRKDAAALAACYTEDGEWRIAGRHLHGRAEIATAFDGFVGRLHRVLMRIGTPLLEIGDGTASGHIYVTEYVKKIDGSAACNIGLYEDGYAAAGAQWRFRSRVWTLIYQGPPDLSADFLI